MTIYIIAVVMWWAHPAFTPDLDSVEIETADGRPLFFQTENQCVAYVDQNLSLLTAFGHAEFPTASAVSAIYCVERVKT